MSEPRVTPEKAIWLSNNLSAFFCLCKVNSAQNDSAILIQAIQKLVEKYRIAIWYEWVESKANLADIPSRIFEEAEEDRQVIRDQMNAWGFAEINIPKSLPNYAKVAAKIEPA